jgi:hypothetical protein
MKGYQNNLSTSEFLYIVFTKINLKLEKVIILMKTNKRTYLETKELFETKSKIIEVFNILSMETNDKELSNLYLYLSSLLSTTDIKNIETVVEFCKNSKKIEDKKESNKL